MGFTITISFMMDMCESSGMTAIQCLIRPKKPVMDLGRGEEQLDSVCILGYESILI